MGLRPYIKVALAVFLFTGGVIFADWDADEPALYYQLPDLAGWSVYSEWGSGSAVADDWTAATTAPITGIHFWGGWKNDVVGATGDIYIRIFSDDTSGPFARPGTQLWDGIFSNSDDNPDNDYTIRFYGRSPQGFYDPRYGDWDKDDHSNMYQYNIPLIAEPYTQQAGHTYWIMMSVAVDGGAWGWNTAESVTGNPAVFWDEAIGWTELTTPADPQKSPDMAFVLNPEPATLLLLGLGAVLVSKGR